uniref:Uncharacterized protein n=1 Tax=Oryza brachyantha TaxID=4533 RepID=J3M9F9_ORYBR
MVKDSAMEEHSLGSGDAMNIFGQSIDVRRPSKSRRRVTHKVHSKKFCLLSQTE